MTTVEQQTTQDNAFIFDKQLLAKEIVRDQIDDWLADAVDAAERMAKGNDDEALHDFRVALRRLRSWLRLFPKLHGYRKKVLGQLKMLGWATNPARDIEVALGCIRLLQTEENSRAVEAALHLAKRSLKRRLAKENKAAIASCLAQWHRLLPRLKQTSAPTSKRQQAPFAQVYLEAIEKQLAAWNRAWESPHLTQHIEDLHVLRIESKRLRYALEWWAERDESVVPLVKALQGVQDTLGEHRDWNLLAKYSAKLAATQIDSAVLRAAHAASESKEAEFLPPESLSQFIALGQRCGSKQAALFTRFVADYGADWREKWRDRLEQCTAQLRDGIST